MLPGDWRGFWPAGAFRFGLGQVFALQGVYGVLMEQQAAVFLQGLAAFPAGIVLWLYVFVVFGSAMSLALLAWPSSLRPADWSTHWIRLPAALLLNFVLTMITSLCWEWIVGHVPIPDPLPIWQAPLW